MRKFIVTTDEVRRVQRRVEANSETEAVVAASMGQGEIEESEFVDCAPQGREPEVREVKLFRVEASMDKVYHLFVEAENEEEAFNIASEEDEGWEEGEEVADSWTVSPIVEEFSEDELEESEADACASCVHHLKELLWPDGESDGDPTSEWDCETLTQISDVLREHGFGLDE